MNPLEFLAHRHPFLLLDVIEADEAGKKARGVRQISCNDALASPDGILPSIFIVEAMAHVSGIASGRKGASMLAGVNDVRFAAPVRAGDVLEVQSTLQRDFGGLVMFDCAASVSGDIVAEGGIILYFNEGS